MDAKFSNPVDLQAPPEIASGGLSVALRFPAVLVAVAGMFAGAVCAQSFPNKPIRMVTAEIGGGADFSTRLIALALTASLGRQVIVDNRGIAAMEIVANAPADGYTLISYGSPMWLAPFTRDKVAWDPVKDFAPITLATNTPN